MKQTFYEVINIWIESKNKSLKVHDLTDQHIHELEEKLRHAGIIS